MPFHAKKLVLAVQLINSAGMVFGEGKIYYSAEAFERAGRDWIGQVGEG